MGDADKKINVEITTHAELTALRNYEQQLVGQIAKAKAVGDAYKDLEIKLGDVRAKLADFSAWDKAGAELTDFASKIPGVGAVVNLLNGSFLTVAGGITAVSGAVKLCVASFHAFEQAEQRLASLNQALAVTGQYSQESSAGVLALVKAQKEHGIAASESMPAIENLIKLGRVHTEQLGTELEAVKGLAFLTGGDLTSASTLWSKALEGNTMMLQRWLPELKTVGTEEEKIALARTRLNAAAKGYDSQVETSIGASKQLTIASGDLLSRFGGLLEKTLGLSDGTRNLAFVFKWYADFMPGVAENTTKVNVKMAALEETSRTVAETLRGAGIALQDLSSTRTGDFTADLKAADDAVKTLNESLDLALRRKDELLSSELAAQKADLRFKEQQALQTSKTPEDKHLVEVFFAGKQATLEDDFKRRKITNEQTAAQAGLTNVETRLQQNQSAVHAARNAEDDAMAARETRQKTLPDDALAQYATLKGILESAKKDLAAAPTLTESGQKPQLRDYYTDRALEIYDRRAADEKLIHDATAKMAEWEKAGVTSLEERMKAEAAALAATHALVEQTTASTAELKKAQADYQQKLTLAGQALETLTVNTAATKLEHNAKITAAQQTVVSKINQEDQDAQTAAAQSASAEKKKAADAEKHRQDEAARLYGLELQEARKGIQGQSLTAEGERANLTAAEFALKKWLATRAPSTMPAGVKAQLDKLPPTAASGQPGVPQANAAPLPGSGLSFPPPLDTSAIATALQHGNAASQAALDKLVAVAEDHSATFAKINQRLDNLRAT